MASRSMLDASNSCAAPLMLPLATSCRTWPQILFSAPFSFTLSPCLRFCAPDLCAMRRNHRIHAPMRNPIKMNIFVRSNRFSQERLHLSIGLVLQIFRGSPSRGGKGGGGRRRWSKGEKWFLLQIYQRERRPAGWRKRRRSIKAHGNADFRSCADILLRHLFRLIDKLDSYARGECLGDL